MSFRIIEFWFGYGSTYTFLSVMRIDQAVANKGIQLVWKPYNLTVLMREKNLPKGPSSHAPKNWHTCGAISSVVRSDIDSLTRSQFNTRWTHRQPFASAISLRSRDGATRSHVGYSR
jgi:2-hydroxychromene-2-carboxylate isomerase